VLLATGIGAGTLVGLAGAGSGVGQRNGNSVSIEGAAADGTSVTVSVTTSVDVRVKGHDASGQRFFIESVSAGTDKKITIRVSEPLTETQDILVRLRTKGSNPETIASDDATVTITETPPKTGVRFVEADPDAGFNYPYYVYLPVPRDGSVPLLVEPNNTGTATNNFQKHENRARQLVEGSTSRRISDALGVPLLVPAFPRPDGDPVDYTHYTHQLDRDTLKLSGTDLERIDLQLLQMVEHAKTETLSDNEFTFTDQIMLNGFSASGNFVDRFTVLHPDRVQSVTAGGLNGMALLPLEKTKGRTLNYHVGIADVESITGDPVDLDALDEVDQFLYMGSEDTNDTIGYRDAWTSDQIEETALAVYGHDMIAERFPFCQEAYRRAGVEAQFRVYEGVGHSSRAARDDLIEFHRRSIEGEDVSDLGQDITSEVTFDYGTTEPKAGEQITFNASDSRAVAGGEILAFTWDFDDGKTAAGAQPSHSFETGGDYNVTLTMITDLGVKRNTTKQITVDAAENTSDRTTEDGCNISGGDGEISLDDLARAAQIYANGGQC